MRGRSSGGWATAVVVVGVVVLTVWGPDLLRRLDLGTPKATRQLVGDWVGPFSIQGTWKPALYGDTPGPHRGGLLYLHAYRLSPNIDWIEAKGELCIAGERTPHTVQLNVTDYRPDGSFSADLHGAPHLGAFPWRGTVTAETLSLGNDIELAIHATLHRSTRAAFRRQATCAPPPEDQ